MILANQGPCTARAKFNAGPLKIQSTLASTTLYKDSPSLRCSTAKFLPLRHLKLRAMGPKMVIIISDNLSV